MREEALNKDTVLGLLRETIHSLERDANDYVDEAGGTSWSETWRA